MTPSPYTPMWNRHGRLDFSGLDLSDQGDRERLVFVLRRVLRRVVADDRPQAADAPMTEALLLEFEGNAREEMSLDTLARISLERGRTTLAGCLALLRYIEVCGREPSPDEETVSSILARMLPFAVVGAVVRTSNGRLHETPDDPLPGVDIVSSLVEPHLPRVYRWT